MANINDQIVFYSDNFFSKFGFADGAIIDDDLFYKFSLGYENIDILLYREYLAVLCKIFHS